MTPVEAEIITRKLAVIIGNIKALEPIKGMAKDDYIEDLYKRKATERLLQELIEAAIDINTHIIVQTGHTAPDDYYASFIRRLPEDSVRSEIERKFRRQGGKGKTTGGGSQCYVEDILVFPTRSTEFAADRSRRLLSGSLLRQENSK